MDETNTQNTNTGDGGEVTGDSQTSGLTQIPENLRGHEAFAGYKAMSDLWQGHIDLSTKTKDLESKLASAIPKLAENSTDEQKAAYRAAMGIPDKPEDYEIPIPEGETTELADSFRQFAVEKGLPKDIAKSTVEWWNGRIGKVKEDYAKELQTRTEAIKTKWGLDYDKNAETVKAVFQAVKDIGINEFATLQVVGPDNKPMPLGNHPAVMEFFLEFGKKILPDSGVRSSGGGDSRTLDEKAKDFYKT